MKTLKNLIYPFAILVAVVACESDEFAVEPEEPLESFEAALDVTHVSEHLLSVGNDINMFVTIESAGESEQLGSVEMNVSHIETYEDSFNNDNRIRIENGQFYLKGETGDILFGSYSGTATLDNGLKELNKELTIKGGQGRYEGAKGNLMLYQKGNEIIVSGGVDLKKDVIQ